MLVIQIHICVIFLCKKQSLCTHKRVMFKKKKKKYNIIIKILTTTKIGLQFGTKTTKQYYFSFLV